MTMITSTLFLLTTALTTTVVHAHLNLTYPTPRTANDYLINFAPGACSYGTCDAFCGDEYLPNENPLTTLPVGVPVNVTWQVRVAHRPRMYRLSLNPIAGEGDSNFDLTDNILTTINNTDAADEGNDGFEGTFTTAVTIPEAAWETCNEASGQPCVLQLFDMYFFVSCANVVLTKTEQSEEEEAGTVAPSMDMTMGGSEGGSMEDTMFGTFNGTMDATSMDTVGITMMVEK